MIKPLGNRILVLPDVAEKTTASGIVLPDSAKELPQTGVVVSSGTVKEVCIDDTVIYSKYTGNEISYGNKDYLLLDIKDVLGVWEDER